MPPLTSDRVTKQVTGLVAHGPVLAGVTVYAGSMLMRDAAGKLQPAKTATGLVGVGRAGERIEAAAGTEVVIYEPGIFAYGNSAGADEITAADIGAKCFAVDDQTVAKTSATNTRSPAGIVHHVDADGVWVRFDEALTRAS